MFMINMKNSFSNLPNRIRFKNIFKNHTSFIQKNDFNFFVGIELKLCVSLYKITPNRLLFISYLKFEFHFLISEYIKII